MGSIGAVAMLRVRLWVVEQCKYKYTPNDLAKLKLYSQKNPRPEEGHN